MSNESDGEDSDEKDKALTVEKVEEVETEEGIEAEQTRKPGKITRLATLKKNKIEKALEKERARLAKQGSLPRGTLDTKKKDIGSAKKSDDKFKRESEEGAFEDESEGTEEQESTEGEEYEEAEEKEYDYVFKPPNDEENIVNMIEQNASQATVIEEEFKLFFEAEEATKAVETGRLHLSAIEGLVGLDLTEETIDFLGIKASLEIHEKWTWVPWKRIQLHMFTYEDTSEFSSLKKEIKIYPDFAMIIGVDEYKDTGHSHFICLTPEAKNRILLPPRLKKRSVVGKKATEEEGWTKLASIRPRKWKSLGSEAEVEQTILKLGRPLTVIEATKDKELFLQSYTFSDSKKDGNPNYYIEFESEDRSHHPYIVAAEVDVGIQSTEPKTTTATQTQLHFKRNKMVQHEIQTMTEGEANTLFESPAVADFFKKVINKMERALQQNELLNIVEDDYKNLKAVKGNEIEFNNESILLQEYITFCELRHSKGRHVTMITFHPTLEDMIVMSLSEDATFDKREDFHSKMLIEPNFVLFWDLKNPGAPQLMLDSPDDVFSFHINPADPTLVCGGCANGQVVLWDLGDFYWDLKSRSAEIRRSTKESKAKRLSFLEKLKDSAEKYIAPLVPSCGMSNLEQSHHSAVTAIKWVPPNCELRKNGTIVQNTVRGRCSQFFSLAGDSTLRLWDIRQPKAGLDDEEEIEVENVIRSNQWLHLENNKWKFSLKFNLDDGSGSMYATLMSLSEASHGRYDIVETKQSRGSEASTGTASELTIKSSHLSRADVESSRSFTKKKPARSSSSYGIHSQHNSEHSDTGDFDQNEIGVEGDNEDESDEEGEGEVVPKQPKIYKHGPVLLPDAKSSILIGTDEGQIGLIDWLKDKEGNVTSEGAAPNKTCHNIYIETAHSGSITSIARSPFYHSLLLVVGGGIISLWKEGSPNPILVTCGSEHFPWCGVWSNTRPGVFFIGTREGALQVWDLIDRSHGPVLTQQITPGRITCCAVAYKLTGKKHFLSLGDSLGNLYVLLIPKFYYKPLGHENNTMKEFMAREEKRMSAWAVDKVSREVKNEEISRTWNEARALKTKGQARKEEEDVEFRLNHEYLDYLEFQANLLAKLKSEEPPLPNAESDVDEEFERILDEARKQELDKLEGQVNEGEVAEAVQDEPEDFDTMFAALQEKERESLAQLIDDDPQKENPSAPSMDPPPPAPPQPIDNAKEG